MVIWHQAFGKLLLGSLAWLLIKLMPNGVVFSSFVFFGKLLLVLHCPWQSARQAINAHVSLCLKIILATAAWLAFHENSHSGHNVLA